MQDSQTEMQKYLTCNERIDSWGQGNQNTQALGRSVAQSFAGRVGQTSCKCTLELRQERLDGQRDLLQEFIERKEDST